MGEPASDRESGAVDVTQLSLAELAMLDDEALETSLHRLLRMCNSAGDRRWDDGSHS